MESTCWSCGKGAVVSDPDSGTLVCISCGRVHDVGAVEFVHQASFTEEGQPDFRVSSFVHHHSQSPYRDQKLTPASAAITSIAARLGLSPTRVEEALHMANSVTSGNLTTPDTGFLPTLATACTLLVARSHHITLSISKATEAASFPTASLADLASCIASHLSLPPLPFFDYATALDHTVRFSTLLSVAAGEKTEVILSRAQFLLCCSSKWSLTVGRHPLPLVVGLTAFAAEVNGVTSVSLKDIAQDISAGLHTSLCWYKELVDVLVCITRELLPWDPDVNAKNLLLNTPILLQLMAQDT